MSKPKKTESDHIAEARSALLEHILPEVVFDGWTEASFETALAQSSVDAGLARQACPRGAIDLAVAFHRLGDQKMLDALSSADQNGLRYRDRITLAVRLRLEAVAPEKEAVRRAAALFALPQNAPEGLQLAWQTMSLIWDSLGDNSEDINWYTKRATLGAVYTSTLMFWLSDTSENHSQTWAFLDRRIEDVMRFEKFKAGVKKSAFGQALFRGPLRILDGIRKPPSAPQEDLPGYTGKSD